MEGDVHGPIIKFQTIIQDLRTELEAYSKNHATADENSERLKEEYHKKIIPFLLQLRKLNRVSKEKGEEKSAKIDQFNRRLLNLKEQCDNITFEVDCLNHEVACAKRRLSPTKSREDGNIRMDLDLNGEDLAPFDIDQVGSMDHAKRLQVVDREEARRRGLQEKLAEATAETEEIGLVCDDTSAQLNRLKPYIRQLLDKLDMGGLSKPERKD